MKNVKLLAVIVCIVAVFDFAVLFADIFIDEKQSETACESGDFLSVLINSNTNLKTDCYVLENWGKEENYTPINEAEKILSATEYTRINRFESSIVKLFQNRKNSIIEVWLRHKRVESGTVLKRPLFAVTASKSLAMRQHRFVFFLVPTKI